VLDSNGQDVYNVQAKTQQEAIRIALTTFAKALKSRNSGALEFVSEHDMSVPTAVLYSEYWTPERIEKVRS
jgi:hypothetical protein